MAIDWTPSQRLAAMPKGSIFNYADADRRVYVAGVIEYATINGETVTVVFSSRKDVENGQPLGAEQANMPFVINLAVYRGQELRATEGSLKLFPSLDRQWPHFIFSRGYGWSGPSD
ncbi:MAG: hypothetical protein AAB865_02910 [Patescibacteria group bacterium]